jgi:hypothetical protein
MNNNVFEEVYFKNVKELYSELSPFGRYKNLLDEGFIFRGESSANYKLIPSVLREENKSKIYSLGRLGKPQGETEYQNEWEYWQQRAEFEALKRFFVLADESGINIPDVPYIRDQILDIFTLNSPANSSDLWLPDDFLGIAAIAQHYGIPTRLLDWSLSYKIALYFAAIGAFVNKYNENDYLILWALNYRVISYYKHTIINKIPLRFVKPPNNKNPNLLAQKGVLTCWEYENLINNRIPPGKLIDRTPLNELLINHVSENRIFTDNATLMYKFYIPIDQCSQLYYLLNKEGISALEIFPGLTGVVKRMNDDGLFNNLIIQENYSV